jgi:hypothetical protein
MNKKLVLMRCATDRFLLPVVFTLFVAGAANAKEKITFTATDHATYQAKPQACPIEEFRDSQPDRPYAVVGVINYHDERHRSSAGSLKLDAVMPKIKVSACRAGGDALINIIVTEVRRLEFAMFNVRATVVHFEPK